LIKTRGSDWISADKQAVAQGATLGASDAACHSAFAGSN
jgi:hypothetical protein